MISARFEKTDLLGVEDLTSDEIKLILDISKSFEEISRRPIKKVPTLRGKTIVNLFFEPSTRTRSSFELAAKRLSADVLNISPSSSSILKGETLRDTAKTIEAMNASMIIIRHPQAGAPHFLSRIIDLPVINAGDGCHEHPTQALLDLYTIQKRKGRIKDLKVLIVGDILHSRVARSDIWGLLKMGARVSLCGPPTLIPRDIALLPIEVHYNLDRVLCDQDVVIILRVQKERQKVNFFPTILEYFTLYGIDNERAFRSGKDLLIMHPGPINRGIEITPEVAESSCSAINEQVTNGLAVRMAVLYLLSGGGGGRR